VAELFDEGTDQNISLFIII